VQREHVALKAPPSRRFFLHLVDCSYWVLGLWFPSVLRWRLYASCLRRYYNRSARTYDRRALFSGYGSGLDASIAMLARQGYSPLLVLDAACGTGFCTLKLASAFPHARVVGLDLAPAMLNVATTTAAESGLANVEFVQGNVGRLPFSKATFDLVVLQNAPVALSELIRATRPTGVVVVTFSLGGGIAPCLMRLFIYRMRRWASVSSIGREAASFWVILRPRS